MHGLGLAGKAADIAVLRKVTGGSQLAQRGWSALTRAADSSKLWIGISGVMVVVGGGTGRRAAAKGVAAIVASSALANAPVKRTVRRSRPRGLTVAGIARAGRRPRTSSFPSGHAASGFAFATAAGLERPGLLIPLESLAVAVAWSRVQSAQHFPSDVVAGGLLGASSGLIVHRLTTRLRRRDDNEREPLPAASAGCSLP
jgi:membrane-associated phospholipid phosphatase